jgi:DNA-binding CsgD family transcriptional regulator
MTLIVDSFFYDVQNEVTEITKNFLLKHRLNFFQFGRVFSDGSVSFLVNNAEFIKNRTKHNRGPKSHIESEQIDKQSYFFLWNGNLSDFDTNLARELDIDNGLCFVQRFKNYYNLVAFGAPIKEKNIVNFYLNNLGLLKNYIAEFQDTAKEIIAQADKRKILLPPDLKDPNTKKLLWNKKQRFHFDYNKIQISLSLREWECLKLLSRGNNIKNIALELKLSPRTIETYIDRLKNKIGLSRKSEILSLFHEKFPDA